MKNHKKFSWMLIVLVLSSLIGGIVSYAAYVSREEKNILFQVGQVESNIEEVFDKPTVFQVEKEIDKEVAVKNSGTSNQFIRVMIFPMITQIGEEILPAKIGNEVILDINSTDWQLGDDGYYYFLKDLAPEEKTTPLFTKVKLNVSTTDTYYREYKDAVFSIQLKLETIQTTKGTYREAWWAGVTPTDGQLKIIDQQLAKNAF